MENSTKSEANIVANNEIEISDLEGPSKLSQDELPSSSNQQNSPVLFIGPLANPNSAVEARYVPRDVKDPMAVNGSCGLYNLGNTCFMNAGLQSLASCPPLLKFYFEEFELTEGLKGTLTGAFYQLLVKMWSGRYSLVQPRHFKDLLGLYHPQFQDYRQHDCQEFLALLLDTFHEQLNRATLSTPTPTPQSTSTLTIAAATTDASQGQGHLNNEDLGEPGASGKTETSECSVSAASDAGYKLLCPETLSSEEEHGGTSGASEALPRSSPGQSSLAAEPGPGRCSLKRISSSSTEAVMASLFSEDSNHSTLSAHSTDSEQSSAFKKLKIEADSTNSSGVSVLSSVSELCTQESSPRAEAHGDQTCAAQPGGGCKETSASDNNNSAESGVESMEMSPPAHSSIPQRKCVRLDIPSSSQGTSLSSDPTWSKVDKERSSDSELAAESAEVEDSTKAEGSSASNGLKKFNNTELVSPTGVMSDVAAPSSQGQTCPNDLPAMTSSPQEASRTNPLHFYCKETKTLNTNVLVSNYVQGDVSTDSEKFAKVDNRSQVPVTKEVNLLQEALQGLEEDKVEKALIGKTLTTNNPTHLMTAAEEGADKASHHVSNLRTVKTKHPGGVLCKATTDPNLLNNSYEYEEEVLVGYSSLVQKPVSAGVGCVKPALECVMGGVVGEKMELEGSVAVDKVSSEVEKNVQMQALSKLKNTLTKSNIREDISDKASTSESTETEDGDMEVEAEESSPSEDEEAEEEEPPSRGSIVGDNSVSLPNPARCFTAADVAAANAAWECYKSRNNSVVVETFQGQFKSTVVCSECDHVSVTYEPFMYLSLPIPHAMERQICVVYVRPHKSTVRYMLTLHKNDKVQQLRHELQTLTGTENTDVIIAEVLDNHVSRILDENIMLRYVNDTARTIYAFQMLPPPEMPPQEEVTAVDDLIPSSPPHIPSPEPSSPAPSGGASSAAATDPFAQPLTIDVSGGDAVAVRSPPSPLLSMDQVNAMLNASGEVERSRSPLASEAATALHGVEGPGDDYDGAEGLAAGSKLSGVIDDTTTSEFGGAGPGGKEEEELQAEGADPMLMGTGLWEWGGGGGGGRDEFLDHHHHPSHHHHHTAPPTSPTSQHSGTFAPRDLNLNLNLNVEDYSTEALFPQSPSSMDVEMDHIPSASDLANPQIWPGPEDMGGVGDKGGGDAGVGSSAMMDQWQTCAICLEELMDSHLLTHQNCKGVFCHSCLEMSAKHSGDLANSCPVCLCPVDVTQDFVPLASSSVVKSKVRLLAVAVTFRTGSNHVVAGGTGAEDKGEGRGGMHLVCGPRLTYLASQQDAGTLYTLVDRVVPFVETYSLHLTDGQGLRCSRCEFSAHCTGCEVAREGEITLQPCDNLTVHFRDELPLEEVEAKTHVSDDVSIQGLRSSNPISIHDCFEAFTQSEVLDEHNPWYCPGCERNQCAKKTMTVWRYPDNLIIHLKRFVYEDLSSTKIDNRVVFPHTSLDITRFLAGPSTSFNVYDLYSIVCHYGGANSGHYTAFCCHPMTNEWYNYNDETVTQQRPGDSEYDSSYILFFRRQGPQLQFDLVKEPPLLDEEEITNDFSAAATTTPSTALIPSHSMDPTPALPTAAEQSTTAIVTFETEGFSIQSDSHPGAGESENQNYDFYN
ncbi:uncharacterized protein LOC143289100 [Babylonia areolata]|uniref:uncharacterized protein LOC143289100 n=1 Tax=Babylonia areolata TaxID=304850 RepID=UPI003FD5B75C